MSSASGLLDSISRSQIIDLAQPLYPGMPHHPAHAPFLYGLQKKHGDYTNPGGASSASEAIAMGAHVGTHIDALCHFSCNGKLFGGEAVAGAQSYPSGLERHTVDTIAPIFRRGVLLDIPHTTGLEVLPVDFVVTPDHLNAASADIEIRPGDVVLIRTGWARYWNDATKFISEVRGPGPALDGARWLSAKQVFAVGSDTVAFEFLPSPEMSVHVHLLVEQGIHIIECLNLEELAASDSNEFLFAAAPLKIRGGTGSPIRPVAVVEA